MSCTIGSVFRLAEQIESNGAAFYSKAADIMVSDWARNILRGLAAEEVRHGETFSKMYKDVVPARRKKAVPDDVLEKYLGSLAKEYVFRKADKEVPVLRSTKSMQSIIRMAIATEEYSILFYVGLSDALNRPVDRKKVRHIIRQEQKHRSTLVESLERMKKLGIK